MSRNKLTDYGLEVKTALLKRGMTQKELEIVVSNKTGLFVDSSYLYKIFTGERKAPKIIEAINEVLSTEQINHTK